MKLRHSAISSPQPGAPFGSPSCLWVVQFLHVRINGGTVIGSDCQLEDITPNERVRALAGASADNDEVAGGCATSGARGSDDEAADCAASGAGGIDNEVAGGCAVSGADGSDDEAAEGCAASGAEGGGWDVASEGCSPSVRPFPRSAHFACLYPSCLLFPRAEAHAGGCQCLNV